MSLSGFAGAAGIKYGLNVRGPKKAAAVAPRPTLAAFASPSDDEGDDDDDGGGDGRAGANAQIARQQQRARDSQKAQEQYAAALAQDASVFDYDGVYDEMKAASKGPSAVEKARGQSRYIGQLLVKAQEREREADVVFERRTLKEREKEDHLYGDKEKFVTAAYKKKLEEDAAFAAAERAADAAEAAAEVTKRRDLSAFYANLLTKNTAFGGEAAAAKPTAPPRPAEAPPRAAPPPPHAALRSPARSVSPEAAPTSLPPPQPQQPADSAPDGKAEPVAPPAAEAAPGAADAAAAAAAASRAKASSDAVASARERFLARKRAREGGADD